jgi:cytochrome c oxidase subunit IV
MAYETAEGEHHAPHVNSFAIFIALCVCTAVSVVFDLVPMNRRLVAVLVLAVAIAKAQFVMRYFMHLKFEGRWKYVLLLPTAILAVGLPLALAPDIAMHYYTDDPELSLNFDDFEHAGGHAEEAHGGALEGGADHAVPAPHAPAGEGGTSE